MEVLTAVFIAIHILSAAALVGGWLAHFKNPTVTVSQWWGAIGMLISGLVLVVFAEIAATPENPVNHMKIGVKLVIALGVFVAALIGRRKDNRGEPVSTGLAHAVGGLSLINLLIAVLWRDYAGA